MFERTGSIDGALHTAIDGYTKVIEVIIAG